MGLQLPCKDHPHQTHPTWQPSPAVLTYISHVSLGGGGGGGAHVLFLLVRDLSPCCLFSCVMCGQQVLWNVTIYGHRMACMALVEVCGQC